MNVTRLLHEELNLACPNIHNTRLNALFQVTEAACQFQKCSLSGLGRTLNIAAKTKHCIKKVDRLLGNKHLHHERADIYCAVALRFVPPGSAPIILVDWSQINEEAGYHILRAALASHGRAITLYEEAHPKSKSHNRKVHGQFLVKLKEVLPENVTPLLVTDAGFKNPWFRQVESLGWNWLGRIRHFTQFKPDASDTWLPCRSMTPGATNQPICLGAIQLAKRNAIACYAHLFKKGLKGRKSI